MKTHAHGLRGIIPPMVTPLATPSTLDEEGTRRQINRLLEGGVHGIFVLGTTGEGPSVSPGVREEIIAVTCDEVKGRVPVLSGISSASFDESVELATLSANHGVTALTITPPFYFPLGQDEIVEYFQHLALRLPLPFIVYDIPAMTKTHMEPDTVRRLMDIKNCIGVKDSSGQMIYHLQLIRLAKSRDDFCVLIGPEELLAEAVGAGSDGGVCGGANVDPRLFVGVYEAALRGDQERIAALRDRIFQLRRVYFYGRFASSMIKGVKCALRQMGVCSDIMSEPFQPFGEEQAGHIEEVLTELGLLEQG